MVKTYDDASGTFDEAAGEFDGEAGIQLYQSAPLSATVTIQTGVPGVTVPQSAVLTATATIYSATSKGAFGM